MARYKIICIIHDRNQVITHVGLSTGTRHTVQEIVNYIRSNTHSFFTLERGYEALVYARQHPVSGRWFLTTRPDSIEENNLDFLPYC